MTPLVFQTHVSPRLQAWFFLWRLTRKFLLGLEYSNINHWFCSVHWKRDGWETPWSAISLDIPRCLCSIFFRALPVSFYSKCQSIDFFVKKTICFYKPWNLFPALRLEWNPGKPKVAKMLLYKAHLVIPTHSIRKLQLWLVPSRFEVTVLKFSMTIGLSNPSFCSLDWSLESAKVSY